MRFSFLFDPRKNGVQVLRWCFAFQFAFVGMFFSASFAQQKNPGTTAASKTISLEEYFRTIEQQNRSLQSVRTSFESLGFQKDASDAALSPFLTLKTQQIDDRKPTIFGSAFSITRNQFKEHSVSVAKLFSTGTQVQLTGLAGETIATSQAGGFNTDVTQGYSSLGVQLSQSLWKGSFGETTRLRWQREDVSRKLQFHQLLLKRNQLYIDLEALYWDWVFLSNQAQMAEQSLLRAQRLSSWVSGRASNGIGDQGDVVSAQALAQSREVQLSQVRDDLRGMQRKIEDAMEIANGSALQTSNESALSLSPEINLEFKRSLRQMVSRVEQGPEGEIPVRLEAWIQKMESQMKSVQAAEAEDSMRPDLSLSAGYKTNPIDTSLTRAAGSLGQDTNPTTSVGLSLVWNLDSSVKEGVRSIAKKDALASELLGERKMRESFLQWTELVRRHGELVKRTEALRELSRLQTRKASLEREKLSKGRSITSTAIQAEQDAADSELNLLKAIIDARKLESQARNYIEPTSLSASAATTQSTEQGVSR